jgi:hypothetical protein
MMQAREVSAGVNADKSGRKGSFQFTDKKVEPIREAKEEEEDFDDAFDRSAGNYDSKNESGFQEPSIREANNFDSQFSASKE